jgi:hypothetical protein
MRNGEDRCDMPAKARPDGEGGETTDRDIHPGARKEEEWVPDHEVVENLSVFFRL